MFYKIFKVSGYRYWEFSFNYSGLKIVQNEDGSIDVQAKVTNTGKKAGDEVVQLYVTDMYASVKTRVTELKDFNRIGLNPGESKLVSFKLSPYQLSLFNDQMDRVVEPGEFKIMVGGKSPSYTAGDRIKNSVGYKTPAEGISGSLNYTLSFKADFMISETGIDENPVNGKRSASVHVRNAGNLTDAGKISMYVNGVKDGDGHHYELKPGEEKVIHFELTNSDAHNITFTTKYKSIIANTGK